MADPLCRWHYALPKNVVELVRALPKRDMPRAAFLSTLEETVKDGDFSFDFSGFQKTAYQLAVQLGLYYIDDNEIYHPRFYDEIDEETASKYLAIVARCYVAPNPYTSAGSFGSDQKPINLFSAIVGYADTLPSGTGFEVNDALKGSFTASLGNPDAVTALMAATPVFTKKGSKVLSYDNTSSSSLTKEGYFNLFPWPQMKKEGNDGSLGENLLDYALTEFKKHRADPEWAGNRGENDWTSYTVNTYTREYYGKFDVAKVRSFSTDEFNELFCGVKDETGKVTFSPMWSGCPGSGWSSVKEGYEANPANVIEFLGDIAESPAMMLSFCKKNFDRPKGFGKSVISELLMKFHPDCCFKYGGKTAEVFKLLKVIDFEPKSDYDDTEYRRVLGVAADIRAKMVAIKITQTLQNELPPDYLTVNEFVGWVYDNKDSLTKNFKEKIMSKQMKAEKPTKYAGQRKELKFDSESKDDELLLRLMASLRAKPFAILAGHSGTGKSRYVKKLAYMTCNANELRNDGGLPGNYLILQVKPNWHDSTELLGYRNAMDSNRYQKTQLIEFLFRAYHFKDTPFFLCLDEMNLAPVEQYFAEFLSSMESEEPVPLNDISDRDDNLFALGCEWTDSLEYLKTNKFSIPKNLFIVGTVNMDETTNQFSRKVLDRAFTIEMTDVDFSKFGLVAKPGYEDTIEESKIAELLNGEFAALELDEEDVKEDAPLVKVQKALENTAFAIAYRFASEYTLLKRAIKVFDAENTMKLDALDQAVLMKVLPRIAGEEEYIRKIYGESDADGLRSALEGKRASLEKIKLILKRANDMKAQHINFWP